MKVTWQRSPLVIYSNAISAAVGIILKPPKMSFAIVLLDLLATQKPRIRYEKHTVLTIDLCVRK